MIRIKYSDIVRTFSEILTESFPEIEILDVEKDYPRPAFFTRLDVDTTGHFMTNYIDSKINFRIYYFPSTTDNNELELLEMRDDLEFLFLVKHNRLINVNGVNIEIEDIGVGEVDNVLHFYLIFTISQEIIDDTDETDINYMEKLELETTLANKHWADTNMKRSE